LGLFAGLFAPVAAFAGADLLDPSAIGKGKASGTGALLDPSGIGLGGSAPATSTPAASTSTASAMGKSSYRGRGMASSVAGSLVNLSATLAGIVRDHKRFKAESEELAEKLRELIDKMTSVMAEYRQGLFCSGCGRTKSDILSKGETFPHSGQKIIKPTQAQLDNKERELQAPIDQTQRDLRNIAETLKRLMDEREEGLAQIDHGISLWHTATSYEHLLLWGQERDSLAHYKAARAKVDAQMKVARAEESQAKTQQASEAARRDLDTWVSAQRTLDAQRVSDRSDIDRAVGQASRMAASERDRLNDAFNRPLLREVLSASVSVILVVRSGGFSGLGGYYRMGDYKPSRHDEIIDSVRSFLTEFVSTPAVDCDSRNSAVLCGTQQFLPATEPSILKPLKDHLNDAFKCDPKIDKLCTPKPANGGPGIRG
jgi:predicted Fe-S protein YdhL (DUF1289 family)